MVAAAMTARAEAGKPASTNAPVRARSTFTQPKQFSEGRDPFYPESTRVFQAVMLDSPNGHKADASSLVVKGYYRDAKSAYVIINNHTFTTGDEGDVLTPGGRIHLRCVDVLPNAVVIEFNGSLHQLPINQPK
jgi:hypothetical protein